jgi:hypothetical protein
VDAFVVIIVGRRLVRGLAMAAGDPMWRTILQAAKALDAESGQTFTRAELISAARRIDASHHEMAYSALFQTMVLEAPTAATNQVGKVFHRIARGQYILIPVEARPKGRSGQIATMRRSPWRDSAPRPFHSDVQYRVNALIAGFDGYVARFVEEVLLAATLFAHESAAFGEHDSAGLYDHGGPLAASMSTISPG